MPADPKFLLKWKRPKRASVTLIWVSKTTDSYTFLGWVPNIFHLFTRSYRRGGRLCPLCGHWWVSGEVWSCCEFICGQRFSLYRVKPAPVFKSEIYLLLEVMHIKSQCVIGVGADGLRMFEHGRLCWLQVRSQDHLVDLKSSVSSLAPDTPWEQKLGFVIMCILLGEHVPS